MGQTQCHRSDTVPSVRHSAIPQTQCHGSDTVPSLRHSAIPQTQGHRSDTVPWVRHSAMGQTQCHRSDTVPSVRHTAIGETQCRRSKMAHRWVISSRRHTLVTGHYKSPSTKLSPLRQHSLPHSDTFFNCDLMTRGWLLPS